MEKLQKFRKTSNEKNRSKIMGSPRKKISLTALSSLTASLFAVTGALAITTYGDFDAEAPPRPAVNTQTLETDNYKLEALELNHIEVKLSKEYIAEQERLKAEEKARIKAAEEEAAAKAAEATLNSKSTSNNSINKPQYTGGGSKEEWMTAAGIPESDWGYVDYIVNRESSWNPNAINSSSGASGLVQALPCGKVPGSCFDPVDNLRWADSYAKQRYNSWSGAYDFWISNNWW